MRVIALVIALAGMAGATPFVEHRVDVPGEVAELAVTRWPDATRIVYVLTRDQTLVAIDTGGKIRWRTALRLRELGGAKSPYYYLKLVGTTALVWSGDIVVAVNGITGKRAWYRTGGLDRPETDGTVVHLRGEGLDEYLDVATGTPATPVDIAIPHASAIVPGRHADGRIELAAPAWTRKLGTVRDGAKPFVELGDLVLVQPAPGDAIVALDAATGAAKWSAPVHGDGVLVDGFRGPMLVWIELFERGGGRLAHRWIAVDRSKTVVKVVDAGHECTVEVKAAVGDDVLAVAHGVPAPGRCAKPVVDLYIAP